MIETSNHIIHEKRDKSIDFIKGTLILLVVLGHSIQYIVYARTNSYWDDTLFKSIYIFHMPAFITISGYLAATKINENTSFSDIIVRRILPILTPLFVWSAILALPGILIKSRDSAGISSILSAYWFLWSVIFGAACAWFAARFGAAYRRVALLIAVFLLLVPVDHNPMPLIRYTVPFYLVGYVSGRSGLKIHSAGLVTTCIAIAIAVTGAFFWNRETYIYNNDLAYWRPQATTDVLLMIPVAAAATLAFLRVASEAYTITNRILISRWLAATGTMTLEIYLVQAPIFKSLRMLPSFELPHGADYLIALSATVAIVAGVIAGVNVSRHISGAQIVLWGRVTFFKR
jgi:fucose 4-O-acetylase-like acetyltransferase